AAHGGRAQRLRAREPGGLEEAWSGVISPLQAAGRRWVAAHLAGHARASCYRASSLQRIAGFAERLRGNNPRGHRSGAAASAAQERMVQPQGVGKAMSKEIWRMGQWLSILR